jgi:hypothetical protein
MLARVIQPIQPADARAVRDLVRELLPLRVESEASMTADERGLGENEFTETLEPFRRRGLAMLCKRASIAWASGHGIHTIVTGNADTSAAMLAVNRKLGYLTYRIRTTLTRR